MKINYYNSNLDKDISLPKNLNDINNFINKTCTEFAGLKILYDKESIKNIEEISNKFSQNKNRYIIFGTGGSSLGARTLVSSQKNKNKVDFYDNIDPIYFENAFKDINFTDTGFIIISKSGHTPETLSQFGSVIELAKKNNLLEEFFSNCLVITEFKESPLFNIAKSKNCPMMEHAKDIGGRYSVFSNVGLIPAILSGFDIRKFRNGALSIIKSKNNESFLTLGKIFKFNTKFNYTSNVLMTYSDYLFYFGKWYLQLWAESIGKDNKGITAIHSIGTTDQHSQLQLYLEGPKDKFFTFYTTNHKNKGLHINNDILKENNLEYIAGKTMGDLMNAEQKATLDTLRNNNFSYREIFIPEINEEILGSIMALSVYETIASCIYFDVNPFNQPAVEQVKKITKEYLNTF